jgi:cyclic beta-1,2-glucan synthetase
MSLVQLLDPPFDKSPMEPGYNKGYEPGVRENGGQYTHAAIWTAMAIAPLGDGARAWEVLGMINPLDHAGTPADAATYKVEPYVVAADVYGVAPHTGRGGWTWYTGSAGWLYRLIVESLLGISLEGERLRISPVLAADWKSFTVHYRYRDTPYHITVRAADNGEASLAMDGVEMEGAAIPLADDRQEHSVEVRVPAANLSAID